MLRQFKKNTKRPETNLSSLDLDKSNIISILYSQSGRGPQAARQSMKDTPVCTNQHHTTVHLYLYLYLHLYVQCNAVAVTVAPLRKKVVKGIFLTPPQTSHWKWGCLRGRRSAKSQRLSWQDMTDCTDS